MSPLYRGSYSGAPTEESWFIIVAPSKVVMSLWCHPFWGNKELRCYTVLHLYWEVMTYQCCTNILRESGLSIVSSPRCSTSQSHGSGVLHLYWNVMIQCFYTYRGIHDSLVHYISNLTFWGVCDWIFAFYFILQQSIYLHSWHGLLSTGYLHRIVVVL